MATDEKPTTKAGRVQHAYAKHGGFTRAALADIHPGINEAEAIAYARGFTRGLIAGGATKEQAQTLVLVASLDDSLLEAGGAYMSLNLIESMFSQKQ